MHMKDLPVHVYEKCVIKNLCKKILVLNFYFDFPWTVKKKCFFKDLFVLEVLQTRTSSIF